MLVGRERELEQLDRMVDRLGTRGGALVLRGDAGIGKSALLRAAADRAHEHAAMVVTTTGSQSEARFAFGGLHQPPRQPEPSTNPPWTKTMVGDVMLMIFSLVSVKSAGYAVRSR